jgi:hypothetical protein
MPRCTHCNTKFEAYEFNGKYCKELDCQVAKGLYKLSKIKDKKRKEVNKDLKQRKEALKTKQDYEKELQPIVNTFIRLRDKDKPCISCDRPLTSKFDAGHFYPAGTYKNIRYHEDNISGQCVHCNRDKHGNLLEYRPRLIKRIGLKRVEELDRLRNEASRITIPELIAMKVIYKDKIKLLR